MNTLGMAALTILVLAVTVWGAVGYWQEASK